MVIFNIIIIIAHLNQFWVDVEKKKQNKVDDFENKLIDWAK